MAAADTIDLDAVRRELIEAGAYLGSQRYHVVLAGNISARVAEDSFLCSRHDGGSASSACAPRRTR